MIEYLAYKLPLVVFWLVLLLGVLVCFALGLVARHRLAMEHGSPDEKAFDIAQGAVSVLAALILGFSFSFASARFETRRELVVDEANAIGTTYLRAAYLPPGPADRFRSTLRDYTQARIAAYAGSEDLGARDAMERKSVAMQDVLWQVAVRAGHDDPRNVQLGLLTQTLNETIDLSARQSAALRSRVPVAMLRLMLIMGLVSAALSGVLFWHGRPSQALLALVVGLLVATTITTVVDLDRPQSGRVRISLEPLQKQLEEMR